MPAAPPRPWHRDPAGATLLAFGVTFEVASIALGIPALIERRAAATAAISAYEDHRRTSLALQWSAAVAGFASIGLIVGAALRYRQVRHRQARVTGWFDGHGAGLALRGRF